MAELNASIAESFRETASQGTDEALAAFSRTFGTDITLATGDSGPLQDSGFSADFSQKGLVLVLITGDKGIAILIPSAGGLIPDWCDNPDATGQSKLSTFAQEWGMNLVPDDFFPDDFLAGITQNMYQAVQNGKLGENPGFLELNLNSSAGASTKAWIVWPIEKPQEVLKPIDSAAPAQPEPAPAQPQTPQDTFASVTPDTGNIGNDFGYDPFQGPEFSGEFGEKRITPDDLPGFSRSLLKIRVPVAAVLARARKPIKTILELGIGSVVQFDKSCDELIELELDRTIIANGEAVKVGEKFGLRINTILLPKERFRKVDVRRDGEFKKTRVLPQIIGKAPIKSIEPQNGN